jgi:hypothetical protein
LELRPYFSAQLLAVAYGVAQMDNGLTWDTDHEYFLHSFDFVDGTPLGYSCGHVYSTLLDDGAALTCYGYLCTKGICLEPVSQSIYFKVFDRVATRV